ncbi:PaaI family thioesterase [Zavarzinia sp. CC-PAN008]|uniref:PaaI family thioesterase n=1 Tax=Zavarzinia sp. CC-PAN008 TaxID=3243332 RepID=UPI003F7433FA
MSATSAPTLKDRIRQVRETGDATGLAQLIPFHRFIGLEVDYRAGELLTRLPFKPELIGNTRLPALHGGATGAFLEITAILHLMMQMDEPVIPKTINLTIDYLRSGRPQEVFARAEVTKHGRRVANVRVTAWQDDPDKPIAAAHAHLLIPEPADKPAG